MMFSNAENFITCETLDAAAQPKSAQAGASSAIRVSRKTPNRSGGNNPPATDENANLPRRFSCQERKKTNQSTPRIRTAKPVDASKRASTDGPGSA
jgi:hypothetical protein